MATKSKTTYKVIAPKPFTYVATNYFGGLWADEKGVFETEDKATYEYLLTFAEFKDITGI